MKKVLRVLVIIAVAAVMILSLSGCNDGNINEIEELRNRINQLTDELSELKQNGIVGEKGAQGIQGEKGEPGEKGDQGAPGIQGEKGEQGEKGDTGAQGARGEKGEQGIQGPKGDTGAQGVPGEKGADGQTPHIGINGNWYIGKTDTGVKAQGAQGIQGEKGDKGEKGEKGDAGEKGEQGIQGEKGENGKDGINGKDGTDGKDGVNGKNGKNGLSTYEIYIKYHTDYTKSEEEWLDDFINGRLSDNKVEEPKQYYTVTVIADDKTLAEIETEEGQTVDLSKIPTEKDGYEFKGWETSAGKLFNTDNPITEDITLTARYEKKPDKPQITFDDDKTISLEEDTIILQANHGVKITINTMYIGIMQSITAEAEVGKLEIKVFSLSDEETYLPIEHSFTDGAYEYTDFGTYAESGLMLEIVYIAENTESTVTIVATMNF